MDKLFSSLKSVLKVDDVVTDNNVCRLHYRFTVVLLLAFSIIVTSKQYIGDPITCMTQGSVPQKMLDAFCWIHSTFSVPSAWKKKVGEEVPYPGVDTYKPGERRVYHVYYQWVCFVLFLQAIMFYTPRYFWKMCEGGRLKAIVLNLNIPVLEAKKRKESREILASYLRDSMGSHKLYAIQYYICEFLNFINVIGQMFLLDVFLGGEFTLYGPKVVQFTFWDYSIRYDPMIHVFPRLTKCNFFAYGPSGDVQRLDAMCLLPINILNEKIFIFLWFWFVILAIFTFVILFFHITVIFSSKVRFLLLCSKGRLAKTDHIEVIVRKCSSSDWFIFYLLARNLDPVNFRDIASEFVKKLGEKPSENP